MLVFCDPKNWVLPRRTRRHSALCMLKKAHMNALMGRTIVAIAEPFFSRRPATDLPMVAAVMGLPARTPHRGHRPHGDRRYHAVTSGTPRKAPLHTIVSENLEGDVEWREAAERRAGLYRGRVLWLSRLRHPLLQIRFCSVRRLRFGVGGDAFVPGPRLSVLRRPSHGTNRRPPRRSRHPAGDRAEDPFHAHGMPC